MNLDKPLLWDQMMPVFRLNGDGVKSFLHGQTTADFLQGTINSFIHCCWLNPIGRVRALLEVRLEHSAADILVLGGDINDLISAFEKIIFPADKVTLQPIREIRRVQVCDPKKPERFASVSWLEINQSLSKEYRDLPIASSAEVEEWRLRIGLPLGDFELNGKNNPFELGLSDLVSLDKGCYLGQETLAKLFHAGKIKQQLMCWSSQVNIPIGATMKKSPLSSSEEKKVGLITSSFMDSNDQSSFGLAMIHHSALMDSSLFLLKDLHCLDEEKLEIYPPLGFVGLNQKS